MEWSGIGVVCCRCVISDVRMEVCSAVCVLDCVGENEHRQHERRGIYGSSCCTERRQI